MAKHPRQQIREAVVSALQWKTAAQGRVFDSRHVPWAKKDMPAIGIFAVSEEAQEANLAGDSDRTLTLAIAAVVSAGGDGNPDDALDSLALEIETAMLVDPEFGGLAMSSTYTGTTIETAEEAGRLFSAATLTYDVRYFTKGSEA